MMLKWFGVWKITTRCKGTYFIKAHAVIKKGNIHHAKLFLQLGVNLSQDSSAHDDGHRCDMCSRLLSDEECEVCGNLHAVEANVKEEALLSLIYIAGYVQKKGRVVKENDFLFYYHKFGKYVDALSRGSLTLLQHCVVQ